MLSKRATARLHPLQTSLRVVVPPNFSMLSNPAGVLGLVAAVARTFEEQNLSDVYVDFSGITSQDLGAHAVLGKLVDEVAQQIKYNNATFRWKGSFPRGAAQQRFVRAMGIIRVLGLRRFYLEESDASKIHLFERTCRHYLRPKLRTKLQDKTERDNAAERFIHHINRCLGRGGRELTPEARAKLCSYVVEILDNAECHAGMIDWTIQGYLDAKLAIPQCEIVIFNFGKSIAETFEELEPNSYTALQIKPYLDLHAKSGWFGRGWRKEDLYTLLALQGSISSKNTSEDTTRGQGMADLVESFQRINDEMNASGGTEPSMYIVSGSTLIKFDRKYRMLSTNGSRRIAFNPTNNLTFPPDPKCVLALQPGHFPGTMIGITFPVQSSSTQATQDAIDPESSR